MVTLIMKKFLFSNFCYSVLICASLIALSNGFTISTSVTQSNFSIRQSPDKGSSGDRQSSSNPCRSGFYQGSQGCIPKGGYDSYCTSNSQCGYGLICEHSRQRCICDVDFTLNSDSVCVLDAIEIQAKMTKVIIALAISAIVLTLIAFALILYGRKVQEARRNMHARSDAARRAGVVHAVVIEDKPPAYDDLSKVLQLSDEPAPPSYDQALRLSTISSSVSDVADSASADGVHVDHATDTREPSAPEAEQDTGV
jgi:hypothetical protein